MTGPSEWSGRKALAARAVVATWLPAPCGQCGKEIGAGENFNVGHHIPRIIRPDLTWEMDNWQPEHKTCSDASAQSVVIAKSKFDTYIEMGLSVSEATDRVFSSPDPPAKPPPLPAHTHGKGEAVEIDERLSWGEFVRSAPTWLQDVTTVPRDAAPPLAMTPVHPEAEGTYGPDACAWMEANLTERGRPIKLRWWQLLTIYRQLEHREDGSLCWGTIVESTPRQSGKSTRLRAVALWRLAVGSDLFEPDQLVIHTGRDLAIVREVMRKAYPWARAHEGDGWSHKRGMTEPEVAYLGTSRWLARSLANTGGYDASMGLVDEAYDVPPEIVDDNITPSMVERVDPQLLLTSTAHRKATSLMRGRISSALAEDDGRTLLIWWGARPGSDIDDPETWRAASPHWSDQRRAKIEEVHRRAMAGESDNEYDDPDPIAALTCQWLNIWPLRERKAVPGDPIVTGEAWEALTEPEPARKPDGAALEAQADGVSLALSWREDDHVIVTAEEYPDLTAAAEAAKGSGFRGRVHVGASLKGNPALTGLRLTGAVGRTSAVAQDLAGYLRDDVLRHTGSDHLSGQVLGLRTRSGADGPRVVSKHRIDAVKAATWAIGAARKSRPGSMKIILPAAV